MNKREMDKCLVRIAQGDQEAFESLYREAGRGVYAFLYPYLYSREDTEDALQTTFLKILRSASTYRPNSDARAWILQIAKNTALNLLEKRRREQITDEIPERAGPDPYRKDALEALQRALTPEEANVVVLHVLWGYKHREITERLGMPLGTVCSKYKYAIEKVKNYLKEEER